MLLVQLEVLLERVLDVLIREDFLVDDVAQVLQDQVDLSDWGGLDEVLNDLLLHACHLCQK